MSRKIKIDSKLEELCKIIVSGLDQRDDLLSEKYIRGYKDKGEALNSAQVAATLPTDDLIQNDRYWGGLQESEGWNESQEDKKYSFRIWPDGREKTFEIVLTERMVREIVDGKLKSVKVRYKVY